MVMKVKRIITTCGIILGGVAATSGASAIVTYKDSADVQFTFSPTLSMSLSADGFVIDNLAPGTTGKSDAVTATVSTNNSAGYVLSATVGNSIYTTTDLVSAGGPRFTMMGSGTALTSGTWGYTVDDGTTYGALSNTTPTVLKSTSAAATSDNTEVKIGAYAASDQYTGTYNNVVNFAVVPNVAPRTITVVAGANVAAVSPSGAASYAEGGGINLTATCNSGSTFSNWGKSGDFGAFADPNSASTTYTVGAGNATLTAYCVSSS